MSDESMLWLLAGGYFHEDYTLRAANQDDAVRRFAELEGADSVQQLIGEIQALLERPAGEDELAELWTRRYHAQFNPSRNGLTYREWFERVLGILRSDDTTVS